jgi:hypothetical protein
MSVRRRAQLALALVLAATSLTAACDRGVTEPGTNATSTSGPLLGIEGDTLQCRSGWTVNQGRYVCNEDA